jgi:hypothetical protein
MKQGKEQFRETQGVNGKSIESLEELLTIYARQRREK